MWTRSPKSLKSVMITLVAFVTGCGGGAEEGNVDLVVPAVRPVTLSVAPFSIRENASSTILFTLSQPLKTDLTFTWTISAITVSPSADFSALTGFITLAAGATAVALVNPVVNETVYENDETFRLTLSQATGATVTLGSAIDFTVVNDDSVSAVVLVTSSQSNGSYGAGTIPISVQFDNPVTVSGSPTLTLETGATDRTAVYASGSGTATLIFNYTVQSGDAASDLDYLSTSALSLAGGSILANGTTVSASRTLPSPGAAGSLASYKDFVIDTIAPVVASVSSTAANGTHKAPASIPITVTFSEIVYVTGTPTIALETGTTDRVVNYSSGSGSTTLTFTYVVQGGDTSSDLEMVSTSALALAGGTIRDAASNNAVLTLASAGGAGSLSAAKALVIDTTGPTITGVSSSAVDGGFKAGAVLPILVTFSESVTVTGTPTLTLETGTVDQSVNYASGSTSAVLTFNYTVQSGDTASDLDVVSAAALALAGGTIADIGGNAAVLTLPIGAGSGSLALQKNLVIDTTQPTVLSVSSSATNGYFKQAGIIDIAISFSEAVSVTGTPQLGLETGTVDQAADYFGGTGTATLVFRYTVQAGDTSTDLDYLATTALTLNSGAIRDAVLNDAVLTLPSPAAAGSLGANKNFFVDTTAPSPPTAVDDLTWSTTLTSSTAVTWLAGSDTAGSGIDSYEFAIGTTAGGIDTLGWTSNAALLTRTQSGLTLTEGTYYYASVRLKDVAGNYSTVAQGDGWRADVTAPAQPASMTDGITTSSTSATPQLDWAASTDSLSGIAQYQIAIGSSSGASDVYAWTNAGAGLTIQISGLTLTEGSAYFASVRAVDTAGNTGVARAADGWTIGWLQQAYLKAANSGTLDAYGTSVSVSGDTMVVGAPSEDSAQTTITNGATAPIDNTLTDAGAAFIYKRTGSTWVQQAYLKAVNAGANDGFGTAVAVDGDTIAVGVPLEDSNQATIDNGATASSDDTNTDSGAVYVYVRSGNTWAQQAYIKAVNGELDDRFGASVALAGDTLVVGAPKESSNQTTVTNGTTASANNTRASSGAVYVYKRSGSTWTQEAYVKAQRPGTGDEFGRSVAIHLDTVVVGAPYEDSNVTAVINGPNASPDNSNLSAGAAYVFFRTGGAWAEEAYLKASNNDAGDEFGTSVAIDTDTIAVGAPLESSAGNVNALAGAVYVYKRAAALWAEESYIKPSNNDAGDKFGQSVSLNGALLCVGAPFESSSQRGNSQLASASADNTSGASGAAYLFRQAGAVWSQLAYFKAPNADASDQFGSAVSISGSSIAIGAVKESSNQVTVTNGPSASSDNTSADSGAVYLMNR